ncbi:DUF6917 domain-containing protein [Streptomyces sp. NRRL S-244]|uniref:DUF6917 domain-containing protein n=1 Tax=Streptomyces sp. NRRL S-244 TaxID=1463897 RepID=UPI0009975568|nr:hypothetical protein [Streptomyces sp. NRRL S-244]
MIAATHHDLPLVRLAAGLGARAGGAGAFSADFAVGTRRVRLLSDDPAVVGYAITVLRSVHVTTAGAGAGPVPDAVCLAVLADPPELARLTASDGEGSEPLSLHGGRSATSGTLSAADGFRVVRMPGREDRFVTDTAARTVLYAGQCGDPHGLREPARLVTALLTALAAQDGPVLAGAAVGSASGAALLLDTGGGTAGAVVPLLHLHGAALLSWSSVQLTADPRDPDRLRLRPLPTGCDVPLAVLRASPALRRHVHLSALPALAASQPPARGTGPRDTDHRGPAAEFTPDELAEALGCRILEQAPPALLVGLRGTDPQAALHRAAAVSAARYPAWHGIGATPGSPQHAPLLKEAATLPWTAADGYDDACARAVAAALRQRRLTDAVPDLPDAANWPRAAMTGRWVAVMEHRRFDRGMRLERWQTRAVPAGSVHELMTTPAPPPAGGDRVDEVSYLGFAEFTGGLLAVGDAVHAADGALLGHVLGFDDTHLPNHMNVVLLSGDRRTGRQRGLPAGGGLRVTSPVDAAAAGTGERR